MNRQSGSRWAAGAPQPLRYTLPAAAGAVWLGLGWVSVAGLAVTVTIVVLLLVAGAPLFVVVPLAAGGAAVCAVPVAGRPALAWIPTVTTYQLARLTGTRGWSRPLPEAADRLLGTDRTARAAADATSVSARSGRGRLRVGIGPRHLELLFPTARDTGPADDSQVTAIAHGRPGRAGHRGRPGRLTVVFELVALGRVGVLDPAEQDTELARWGSSLAVLCADPLVRSVQWLTHARPDTRTTSVGASLSTSTTTAPTYQEAPVDSESAQPQPKSLQGFGQDLQQDYRILADAITQQATRHRHLLALTIDTPVGDQMPVERVGHDLTTTGSSTRGNTPGSAHGTRSGRDAVDAVLTSVLTGVARDAATALLAADLLARPLSARELGTELRLLLDPAFVERPSEACGGATDNVAATEDDLESGWLQDQRQWLPVSARGGWDSCRTDDTHHRCFAITGWPRQALPADWLAPLLHDTPPVGTSRTLTVHARPVRPEHAARRARAASAKAHLDASDRSRMGFTPHAGSAHDSLAEADAAATEAELIAGYRMTDTSALLTISAVDTEHLELACRQLRAVAVAHRLDLRPLHGQHLTALASALPLGLHAGASR